jgi:hypothetical protein
LLRECVKFDDIPQKLDVVFKLNLLNELLSYCIELAEIRISEIFSSTPNYQTIIDLFRQRTLVKSNYEFPFLKICQEIKDLLQLGMINIDNLEKSKLEDLSDSLQELDLLTKLNDLQLSKVNPLEEKEKDQLLIQELEKFEAEKNLNSKDLIQKLENLIQESNNTGLTEDGLYQDEIDEDEIDEDGIDEDGIDEDGIDEDDIDEDATQNG